VALVARRMELLESLAAEIEAAGGRALAIRCDVTDRAQVFAAVRQAEAALGPTGRLVANAGAAEVTRAAEFDAAHVERQLRLNVLGAAYGIEAVLPGMLARRSGHLVAVSSLAGYRGVPGAAAYSASKAALSNLMESLRVDLRGSGVAVTLIVPGFVRVKPAQKAKKKRNRPFRMDLEPATERIHRAIQARVPVYAFPLPLVALAWLGRVLPAGLYDRVLAGRGPKASRGGVDAGGGGSTGPRASTGSPARAETGGTPGIGTPER
jgi:short-subunit dehydrogenase